MIGYILIVASFVCMIALVALIISFIIVVRSIKEVPPPIQYDLFYPPE